MSDQVSPSHQAGLESEPTLQGRHVQLIKRRPIGSEHAEPLDPLAGLWQSDAEPSQRSMTVRPDADRGTTRPRGSRGFDDDNVVTLRQQGRRDRESADARTDDHDLHG
jgi:hypothetical protein